MAFIPKSQWSKYKNIINGFHDDANQDELAWYPELDVVSLHGEDESSLGEPIILKCLFLYNYFRTWPIIGYTITGEVDKQSVVALINVEYMKSIEPNIVTPQDKLNYRPDKDLFIHRGDRYIATGDTFVSQAHNDPLLFMIILKRTLNHQYQTDGKV